MTAWKPTATVLFARYRLLQKLLQDGRLETWTADCDRHGVVILRAWRFDSDSPTEAERGLWDSELRILQRLTGLPGAGHTLAKLVDAGIDDATRRFVLISSAPGTVTLEQAVEAGNAPVWWHAIASDPWERARVWRAIATLARGLALVHSQDLIHRRIGTNAILVDPSDPSPDSIRLWGFEWSVRPGVSVSAAPADVDPTTSTFLSFEADWRAFAELSAAIILRRPRASVEDLESALATAPLRRSERSFLQILLRRRHRNLPSPEMLIDRFETLARELEGQAHRGGTVGLVVHMPYGSERYASFKDLCDVEHPSELQVVAAVAADLSEAKLIEKAHPGTRRLSYYLLGAQKVYLIDRFQRHGSGAPPDWSLAFCRRAERFRTAPGASVRVIDLGETTIQVIRSSQLRRTRIHSFARWDAQLFPRGTGNAPLPRGSERLLDFARLANDVDFLLCEAELFPYVLVDQDIDAKADECVVQLAPSPTADERDLPAFAGRYDDLADFLNSVAVSGGGFPQVLLTDHYQMRIPRPEESDFWTVVRVESTSGSDEAPNVVTLRRAKARGVPPRRGYLRSRGFGGQRALVSRRSDAMRQMAAHPFLLRAITDPAFSQIINPHDTPPDAPSSLDLDESKQRALSAIWSLRPLFLLQGPPGTGKTHLVIRLIEQILKDDPHARVLVSAKEHHAVDVILERLWKLRQIGGLNSEPILLRLGEKSAVPATNRDLLLSTMTEALARTSTRGEASNDVWLSSLRRGIAELTDDEQDRFPVEFQELSRLLYSAAHVTFATATDSVLSDFVARRGVYDWVIIEEAGKCHAFELLLPMQAGFRWLLIGDDKQLGPFRERDFQDALDDLANVTDALVGLAARQRRLVAPENAVRYRQYKDWLTSPSEEGTDAPTVDTGWLLPFERMYRSCSPESGGEDGAHGRVLTVQHRMNPAVERIVRRTLYPALEAGQEIPPAMLRIGGRARPVGVVWLDIPWCTQGGQTEAQPADGSGYTNRAEVAAISDFLGGGTIENLESLSLAILSPYRRQVGYLERIGAQVPDSHARRVFQTVDGFQGDEADVVVVSLVRNNAARPGAGIGFLQDRRRMNVTVSRAARCLVLVGSLSFWRFQTLDESADLADEDRAYWGEFFAEFDALYEEGLAAVVAPLAEEG